MVSCRKLRGCSLNRIFNALSIGLQYTLSFEWPGFGLKWLVTVRPKGQSPTVKASLCNIFNSEIDSNCISILSPAENNGVTIELKIKVSYSWACTFDSLIYMFPLHRMAIAAFRILHQIGLLFPLNVFH